MMKIWYNSTKILQEANHAAYDYALNSFQATVWVLLMMSAETAMRAMICCTVSL